MAHRHPRLRLRGPHRLRHRLPLDRDGRRRRPPGGKPDGAGPLPRFLTGTLKVEYLAPTPIDATLRLRSRIVEVKGRKVTVATELTARGTLCARGEAILIKVPDHFEPGAA